MPSEETVEVIQRELLDWYREHRRDLPWRKDKDPYRIWVSEIMLQQTRVDTVIPYYERFLNQFPTLNDLANATDDQVIKAWEGLGYYSRARNLHSAVKEVAANYGGKVPDELKTISKLKGIGLYTAGAILSIAYDKKAPAVDGNVMRVFSRLFAIPDDIARQSTRKKMELIAEHLIPAHAPGDFNQALMELGAMICTPQSPHCLFCPVQTVCHAFHEGLQDELPRKKKAKPPVQVNVLFAWFLQGDKVLIEKRPDTGLLAGMWALPTVEQQAGESPLRTMEKFCDKKTIPATNYIVKSQLEHIFSHLHWKIVLVQAEVTDSTFPLPEGWEWSELDDLHTKAFANVYRKALKNLL
ncbi:A/G-specific adenine glycosylase [Paenactinomyces guangxiensis]|uniref:Adenine DNA glycosylase n=1 Tax=Paenactinomyces guangxiensis TaxID=1490290 RepID=A0A7W2A8C0_9BACL|nr:A/G-specific adenine glycosylase [Paenactinomyces guangxiensis]MBH8592411.1 A/G-specific adenine glycosylase [Paenactinomyces guangxiensis]